VTGAMIDSNYGKTNFKVCSEASCQSICYNWVVQSFSEFWWHQMQILMVF